MKTRIITASVLILGISILLYASFYFYGSVKYSLSLIAFIASALSAFEVSRIVSKRTPSFYILFFVPACISFGLNFFCAITQNGDFQDFYLVNSLAIFLICSSFFSFLHVFWVSICSRNSGLDFNSQTISTAKSGEFPATICSCVILVFGGNSLIWLSNYPKIAFAVVLSVIITDSMAYFGGKQLGRIRLAPVVSPNKTYEGVFCGITSALLVFNLTGLIEDFFNISNLVFANLFLIFLILISILGDLTQSYFKRVYGVKDSGNLLPGHGGVYDRIDAQLAAASLSGAFVIVLRNFG